MAVKRKEGDIVYHQCIDNCPDNHKFLWLMGKAGIPPHPRGSKRPLGHEEDLSPCFLRTCIDDQCDKWNNTVALHALTLHDAEQEIPRLRAAQVAGEAHRHWSMAYGVSECQMYDDKPEGP